MVDFNVFIEVRQVLGVVFEFIFCISLSFAIADFGINLL